jgi:hypothetical protein
MQFIHFGFFSLLEIQDVNLRKVSLLNKLAELSKPQRDTLQVVIAHLSK